MKKLIFRLRQYILEKLENDPLFSSINSDTADIQHYEYNKEHVIEEYIRPKLLTNIDGIMYELNWYSMDFDRGDTLYYQEGVVEYMDEEDWEDYYMEPVGYADTFVFDIPEVREFKAKFRDYEGDWYTFSEGHNTPFRKISRLFYRQGIDRINRVCSYMGAHYEYFYEKQRSNPLWLYWIPKFRGNRDLYTYTMFDEEPVFGAWARCVNVTLDKRYKRAPGYRIGLVEFVYKVASRGRQRIVIEVGHVWRQGFFSNFRKVWMPPLTGIDFIDSFTAGIIKVYVVYTIAYYEVEYALHKVWTGTASGISRLNGYAWRRLWSFRLRSVPGETGHAIENHRVYYDDNHQGPYVIMRKRIWPSIIYPKGSPLGWFIGFDWRLDLVRSLSWPRLSFYFKWRKIRFFRYVTPLPFYFLFLPLHWTFQEIVKPLALFIFSPFPLAVLFWTKFLPYFVKHTLPIFFYHLRRNPTLILLIPFMVLDVFFYRYYTLMEFPMRVIILLGLLCLFLAYTAVFVIIPTLFFLIFLLIPLLFVFTYLYFFSPEHKLQLPIHMRKGFDLKAEKERRTEAWKREVRDAEDKGFVPPPEPADPYLSMPWYDRPFEHKSRPDHWHVDYKEKWSARPIISYENVESEFWDYHDDVKRKRWGFFVVRFFLVLVRFINFVFRFIRFIWYYFVVPFSEWSYSRSFIARYFYLPFRYAYARKTYYFWRDGWEWVADCVIFSNFIEFWILAPFFTFVQNVVYPFLQVFYTIIHNSFSLVWFLLNFTFKKFIKKPYLFVRLYVVHSIRRSLWRYLNLQRPSWKVTLVLRFLIRMPYKFLYRLPAPYVYVWWWIFVNAWVTYGIIWYCPYFWYWFGPRFILWWILIPLSVCAFYPIFYYQRHFYRQDTPEDRLTVIWWLGLPLYFIYVLRKKYSEGDSEYFHVYIPEWPSTHPAAEYWAKIWGSQFLDWFYVSFIHLLVFLKSYLYSLSGVKFFLYIHSMCVAKLTSLLLFLFPPLP